MQNGPYPGRYCRAFDVVAIGSSLGGPAALSLILRSLPRDFPASILIAQHVSASTARYLMRELGLSSRIPVRWAQHGNRIRPGRVYLAPFDHHVLVAPDRTLLLSHSPKIKFCRPAAEPLFASAAGTYRERALGLVLTGCNTDGTVGAQTIKWMGGRVIAQDPRTARAPGMPRGAIAAGVVDYVVPLENIAAALIALIMVPGVADYLRVGAAA